MDKAIQIAQHPVKPLEEGEVAYDCDYRKFEEIVEYMNEMGAPITIYDLMELIDGKLSGRIVSGNQDPYLRYTLICKPNKTDNHVVRKQ